MRLAGMVARIWSRAKTPWRGSSENEPQCRAGHREIAMATIRDQLHELIDVLPGDQLETVLDFARILSRRRVVVIDESPIDGDAPAPAQGQRYLAAHGIEVPGP